MFATFVGFVTGVLFITEMVNKMFKVENTNVRMVVSWVMSFGLAALGLWMQKEWVLNIKRQCEEQGVPFFFKQWGTYGEDGVKRNVKANGCTIDGQIYQAWPHCYKQ